MTSHVSDEQLSLLLDGEQSLTAREAVRNHLEQCPACAERHDRFVAAVSALRIERALHWDETQTERVVAVTALPRRRELGLPLAAGLLAATALLGMAYRMPLRSGYGLVSSFVCSVGRATGSPLGSVSAGSILALLVLAIVAPAISLRLARWR